MKVLINYQTKDNLRLVDVIEAKIRRTSDEYYNQNVQMDNSTEDYMVIMIGNGKTYCSRGYTKEQACRLVRDLYNSDEKCDFSELANPFTYLS